MANASRDENEVPTLIGVSSSDGSTPVKVYADPITHRLLVDTGGGGTGTVTSITAGTGLTATPSNPITTSGTIELATDIAPIATLGSPLQLIRVNGAGTALEYFSGSFISGLTVGTTTISSGTTTRILYDNAGVLGEYTITGSGTVVAMQTSPTFVTDITTPVIKLSGTSNQAVFQSAGVTGTLTWTPTSTNKTITFPDRTLTVDNITTSTTTNGTGFLKGNGSAISFDNSTYITGLVVGTTTIGSGTTTRILYDNAGVLGEYTLTGSGTVVAMQTAPTFATSITTPSVLATANDSGALGAAATSFSDLFLASGALIGFANGNAVITHSSGVIGVTTGDLRVTSANVGTNADSVPTLSSTSTLTNKTLTSPAITTGTYTGTQLLNENASVGLDPAGSADGKYTGITVTATAGYSQAFGDLVYLDPTDSRWEATDANSGGGADGDARGILGMVVVAGTDGNPCTILLQGIIRADAKFPSFTINNPIYVSESAGLVTQTQPTTTDVVIRIVGAALTADEMYFNPDNTWITHT